jgi:endonuclease G
MAQQLVSKIFQIFALSILYGITATLAFADQNNFEQCRHLFANDTPPVVHQHEELQTRALCFNSFAVLHSGKSRTPIYSAEKLNRQILQEAKKHQRTNKFFADARLPRAERAELDDYHGSGYDRVQAGLRSLCQTSLGVLAG